MTDHYTPAPGSVAETVVNHFRTHPNESMTADDMFEKFGFNRSANLRMGLIDAYSTDLLTRTEVAGELTYGAGKRMLVDLGLAKPARKAASAKTLSLATTLPASAKRALGRPRAQPKGLTMDGFPDPASVPLEDGVPCNRGATRVDWAPLLARMAVGQSACLPLRCKPTLSKYIAGLHKQSSKKFTVTCYQAAAELRVWRVA